MYKIVFQNSFFVAVDKSAGTLSVPSRLGEKEERPCVGTMLQKELGRQIYPCHRLDFEVSGLLLFALEKDAHRIASRWFEQGEIQKKYEAWTTGEEPTFSKEVWHSKLLRGKKGPMKLLMEKSQLPMSLIWEKQLKDFYVLNLNQ